MSELQELQQRMSDISTEMAEYIDEPMHRVRMFQPAFAVLYPRTIEQVQVEYKLIETAGRTAYRSESHIEPGSAVKFIKKINGLGHGSVLEHGRMTVRFFTDRGVTHELVRHRLCSFTQESTRYCNYNKRGLAFIRPSTWDSWSEAQQRDWKASMRKACKYYSSLVESGATPEQARAVLPNSLAANIVVTANFREWKHIFSLRLSEAAHPDIRELLQPLYKWCCEFMPEVFMEECK